MPADAIYGFAFIAIAAWIGLFYVATYRSSGSLPTSRPRRVYRMPGRFKKNPLKKEPAPYLTDARQ